LQARRRPVAILCAVSVATAPGPLFICSECGHVNPPDRWSCLECGRERPHPEEFPEPPATHTVPRQRHASGTPSAALAAPFVLVGVLVAVALATSSPVTRRVVPAPPPPVALPRVPDHGAAQQPPPPVRRVASGPLAPVVGYWHAVASHRYAAAYAQLAPGAVALSAPEFVAYERSTGVLGAQFRGRVTARAGGAATVAVTALVTRDRRYGCRSWSGTYTVEQRAGRWVIQRAAITSAPC
jgi:hypothetical protein